MCHVRFVSSHSKESSFLVLCYREQPVETCNEEDPSQEVGHVKEKPHKCSECGKAFSRKDHLSRHMIIHNEQRPYSCRICARAFSQKVYLTRHEQTHGAEKPFSCSACGKRFLRKQELVRH